MAEPISSSNVLSVRLVIAPAIVVSRLFLVVVLRSVFYRIRGRIGFRCDTRHRVDDPATSQAGSLSVCSQANVRRRWQPCTLTQLR